MSQKGNFQYRFQYSIDFSIECLKEPYRSVLKVGADALYGMLSAFLDLSFLVPLGADLWVFISDS